MAPRGRRKRAGLMRDAMRNFGFDERVINETIKELLELYGGADGWMDGWSFIEDGCYNVLLTRCLEKQEEKEKQVAEEQEKQHQIVLQVHEHEQHVETDTLSTTTEAVIDTSPVALLTNYGHNPVEDAGWISEEDTDSEEDNNGNNVVVDDDDDEMIQLTPEPLCEELKELVMEVQGQKKRKIL